MRRRAGDDRRGAGALPVVRVDEVVAAALAGGEIEDARGEGANVRHLVFLVERLGRPGGDPDEAEARGDCFDISAVAVSPGEHVDFVAEGGKLFREGKDVDIEPAGDAPAESSEGAGVIGDLGDSLHGLSIVPERLRVVVNRPCGVTFQAVWRRNVAEARSKAATVVPNTTSASTERRAPRSSRATRSRAS